MGVQVVGGAVVKEASSQAFLSVGWVAWEEVVESELVVWVVGQVEVEVVA